MKLSAADKLRLIGILASVLAEQGSTDYQTGSHEELDDIQAADADIFAEISEGAIALLDQFPAPAASTETPESPAPEASAESAEDEEDPIPPAQPSIFDRARAVLSSRSDLVDRIATIEEELTNVRAERDDLQSQLATAQAEAEGARELAARITELEAEHKTVAQATASVALTNHVQPAEAENLPGPGEPSLTMDDLHEQLAAANDPREVGRIAAQLNELREEEWASGGSN